ncbi:MAG: hypothetical protein OXD43_03085 [Bacteroidetes bacterium]|nr:hypothetical protein [Bacteroidota bacterium]
MESYLDLTRLTLGLGDDWKIDKVLLDEQKQRVDLYISHLGGVRDSGGKGGPRNKLARYS